ncbi:MAG: hypothetical protein AB1938_04595 [Myxococcota bacterium]
MATALESLLLEAKEELSARVADAVAFLLGQSQADRKRLRDQVKDLYNVRSKYIHEGEYQGDEMRRHEALDVVARTISKEAGLLPEADDEELPAGTVGTRSS